ncbi:MAG: hypothetical protein EOP56_12485 [Sphingobacteriales bacterium]|nr:MAG: hypothetical protein EOP56_12485 [Sphingobacteriales bacterium]
MTAKLNTEVYDQLKSEGYKYLVLDKVERHSVPKPVFIFKLFKEMPEASSKQSIMLIEDQMFSYIAYGVVQHVDIQVML